MPKLLFYAGTAFCLFLALSSAAEALREAHSGSLAFAALQSNGAVSSRAAWAIFAALIAGLAAAAMFVRMAALLAARNLFGAFLALFSVTGAVGALSALLLLQLRIVVTLRQAGAAGFTAPLREVHFALFLLLGYFVSLSLLALRPYFRVQASRMLAVLVFLPLPVYLLFLGQELFMTASAAPLPSSSPASLGYLFIIAILFFAIAIHCFRHRHLFLEMTNLRELLDSRIDHASRAAGRPIGGVAFDS